MSTTAALRTPLYELHERLGAKLVEFAGYAMPVHYPTGIMVEHLHTRSAAGLFDVSHMGQLRLTGADRVRVLEALVPGDIAGLAPGRMRYSVFTNDRGGILDDLMITNAGDHLFLVVNAACKAADTAHLRRHLAGAAALEPLDDRALLALQGPAAAEVMGALVGQAPTMGFMTGAAVTVDGLPCFLTRSGYTGEDGFEISVPAGGAVRVAERLLAHPAVKPIGLGARDSLRLEAGLCLYGHDIDETTNVVEADLGWILSKRRRQAGGYPGAQAIERQIAAGAARKRVGIKPEGRAPAREETAILDQAGAALGKVTSGGFGPSVDGPIAMGYVAAAGATLGALVSLVVRGTPRPARIAPMPFVPHRYYRSPKP